MGKKRKNKKRKNKMGKGFVYERNSADSWEVELDVVNACGKAPKNVIVWIEPLAKTKIDRLMERFPNIEWLAYLLGEGNIVKDIFVPKQTVTTTSVTNISCPEFNKLPHIGVIHSHHGMGNGFSGTDHEWINQNHNISLCISKSGINGQARWTTPCGSMKIVPTITKLKLDVELDEKVFLEIADKMIKPQKIVRHVPDVQDVQNNLGNNFSVKVLNPKDKNVESKTIWSRHCSELEDEMEELNFDKELTLEEELALLEDNAGFA